MQKKSFKMGELIERAPVIPITQQEDAKDSSCVLYYYLFGWGPNRNIPAIALGYASLYNHSFSPNAYYVPRETLLCFDIIAYQPIQAGEEIVINYNRNPESRDPVWFPLSED